MTLDLDRQLTEYTKILDQAIPNLDPSDLLAAVVTQSVSARVEPHSILRRRPLLTVATAIVVVLLVIGGTSLLLLRDGSIEPADTPEGTVVMTTQPQDATPPPATTQPPLDEAEIIPGLEGSTYFAARIAAGSQDGVDFDRVERVWYLDSETWRWETPVWVSEGSTELEGQVTVRAEGEMFDYRPHSNRFGITPVGLLEPGVFDPMKEIFLEFAYDCGGSGCVRISDGDSWESCQAVEPSRIAAAVVRYQCDRVQDGYPQQLTLELDGEGRTWWMASVWEYDSDTWSRTEYELLELDANPTFTADLFEFTCPTEDCVDEAAPHDPFTGPLVGKPAPEMVADLVGGGEFDLSEVTENVIVSFWAPWCGPCNDELVTLQQLASDYPDLTIVIGAVISQHDEVVQGMSDLNIAFPVVDLYERNLVGGNYVADNWGSGIPTTVFIDGSGTVVAAQSGHEGIEKLQEILEKLGW